MSVPSSATRLADPHARRPLPCPLGGAGPRLTDVDPAALLDELAGLRADGIVGTKDRSALVAALLAERRGLPGPRPAAVVACQHKPTSREIQQRVAPSDAAVCAARRVASVSGPVVREAGGGRLSQKARRVDDGAVLGRRARVRVRLRDRISPASPRKQPAASSSRSSSHGDEVTLEGYVHEGE